MRWEDERYVRVYTRDTLTWLALSWEARALFVFVLRKVDRAGLLDLGAHGARGLAGLVGMPVGIVEGCLSELTQGVEPPVELRGTTIVVPNYVEAQEATASDKARSANYRARLKARDEIRVTNGDGTPAARNGGAATIRDVSGESVTERNGAVTLRDDSSPRTVLSRTTPSVPSQISDRGGGGNLGSSVDVPAEKPPPPPPASADQKQLLAFLAQAWPTLVDAPGLVVTWKSLWTGIDLLAEVKAAKAKEIALRKNHDQDPAKYLVHWFKIAAADARAGRHRNGTGTSSAPAKTARQRAAETTREADARDRQFREEQARGTDPRALVHRLWLWQHWPTDYPQYAPPEASTA